MHDGSVLCSDRLKLRPSAAAHGFAPSRGVGPQGFDQSLVLGAVGVELNNQTVLGRRHVAISCALKGLDQLLVLLANLFELQLFVVSDGLLPRRRAAG